MKPEAYHIADLIGKFLRQTISEEEMATLQAWLGESEENRQLLASFRNADARRQDIDFLSTIDTDAAWDRFRGRKKRTPLVKLMKFSGYAAAAVLLLFVAWRWLTPTGPIDDRVVPDVTNRYQNDVLPGEHRAQLLLSDGRHIDLESAVDSLNERDGTLIAGKAKGEIHYVPGETDTDTLLYNTLVVPKAGTYRIVLSDGTKVWVNALSELRFPVRFANHERKVSIKGEAYFEVAHDADRPFRVEVNGSEVEVLGTQFNVNAYTDVVSTTLVEGAVKVSAGQAASILQPGEQSQVRNGVVTVRRADVAKVIAWQQGEFYFKSDDITEVMNQLSRWYDLQVTYRGEALRATSYTGHISRNVNLTEVLEMLGYLSKAEFEVDGRRVEVNFSK